MKLATIGGRLYANLFATERLVTVGGRLYATTGGVGALPHTVLFFSGAEFGDLADWDALKENAIWGGAPTAVSDVKHAGDYSMRVYMPATGQEYGYAIAYFRKADGSIAAEGDYDDFYIGWWFRTANPPSSICPICRSVGNYEMERCPYLNYRTDGKLELTILTTTDVADDVLPLNCWLYLELHVVHAGANTSATLRVNEQVVAEVLDIAYDYDRIGFWLGANTCAAGPITLWFDDVIACTSGWPGMSECSKVNKPVGIGTYDQWGQYPDSGNKYEKVDELPKDADEDDTYILDTVTGEKQTFSHDGLGGYKDRVAILGVSIWVRSKAGASSPVQHMGKSGSTDFFSADQAEVAYGWRLPLYRSHDPNTGAAWTEAAVDALVAGVKAGGANESRATTIGVFVHYRQLEYSLAPSPAITSAAVPSPALSLELTLAPIPVIASVVVPSPVLSLTRTLTPDSVVAPAAIPSPVLSLSRTLTPDPTTALAAVPSPTITQGSTLTPTPVVAQAVVPSPVMALELILTPNPVTAQAVIPSPVLAPENILAPTPVAASVVVPSPVLSLVLTLTPDPVIAAAVVPEPDIAIGGIITLQPTPVVAIAVIPAPVLTQGNTLTPDPVASATAVPSPAISLALALAPTPVAAAALVPEPNIVVLTGITLQPTPVSAATAVPSPALSLAKTLLPTPVVAPATVPAPVLATSLTLLPTPAIVAGAVPNPVLALAKVLLPTPVLALAVVPEPRIDILLYILNPTPVISVAVVPAPYLDVVTVAPYAPPSFLTLLQILKEARQMVDEDRRRVPVACPECGGLLEQNKRNALNCPMGHWTDTGGGGGR